MITFGVIAALLIVLALVFVVPPLFRRAHPAVVEAGPDLAIYRDQLADLERDLQAGALTTDRYEQARQELERRLAEELQADTATVTSPAAGKGVALAVVAGVPVLAITLYLVLGAPAVAGSGSDNTG